MPAVYQSRPFDPHLTHLIRALALFHKDPHHSLRILSRKPLHLSIPDQSRSIPCDFPPASNGVPISCAGRCRRRPPPMLRVPSAAAATTTTTSSPLPPFPSLPAVFSGHLPHLLGRRPLQVRRGVRAAHPRRRRRHMLLTLLHRHAPRPPPSGTRCSLRTSTPSARSWGSDRRHRRRRPLISSLGCLSRPSFLALT